jgi:hypothetical protein
LSLPIDIGCGVSMESQTDAINEGAAGAVQALLNGCPPCNPPVVS